MTHYTMWDNQQNEVVDVTYSLYTLVEEALFIYEALEITRINKG